MKDAIQEGRRGMATESKTRHRLLAVDDDETIRTMLKDFFEGAGYAVDTAQDAGEALQRLSQELRRDPVGRHDAQGQRTDAV